MRHFFNTWSALHLSVKKTFLFVFFKNTLNPQKSCPFFWIQLYSLIPPACALSTSTSQVPFIVCTLCNYLVLSGDGGLLGTFSFPFKILHKLRKPISKSILKVKKQTFKIIKVSIQKNQQLQFLLTVFVHLVIDNENFHFF